MRRSRAGLAALGALAAWAGGLHGQSPFAFEYRPAAGSRIQALYQTEGDLLLVGLPDMPDTSLGAFEALVSVTRRVEEVLDGAFVVTESVDSSRGAYRLRPGDRWIPLELPAGPTPPVRTLVDAGMRATPLEGPADPWQEKMLRGLRGVVLVDFPRAASAPGDGWSGTVTYPYTVEVPGRPPSVVAVSLEGRVLAAMDSVVVRTSDTLVFVSGRGGFNPLTVDSAFAFDGIDRPVAVWGSFVTSLIWSTGWQGWVSGVTTLRMFHRVEALPARGLGEVTMRADLTSRLRVRP